MSANFSEAPGAVLLAKHAEVVRAAGGLIVRRRPGEALLVAVVHRPHRMDWSFPKGKQEPGESLEDCAVREVEEETGLVCILGPFLGHTEYLDRKQRPKVVAYWVMFPIGTSVARDGEVDELRWEDPVRASRLLSYERDRELLVVLSAMQDLGTLAD